MSRFIRDLQTAWRQYRLIHTISSRIAGLSMIWFFGLCFWTVFQRAEPTSISLAILAFMAFCGVFLLGGQKAAETWVSRRGESRFRSSTANECPTGDQPAYPASHDAEDDK